MRHRVPTAPARPRTNLSWKGEEIANEEVTCGVDEPVSGSLESVVSEFGCEELPLRSKKDEILLLLLTLPVSPAGQFDALLAPYASPPTSAIENARELLKQTKGNETGTRVYTNQLLTD